jgi:hypothetical protein
VEGGHLWIDNKISKWNFGTDIKSNFTAHSSQKMQIWYQCSKNRTESRIARSWRTFSAFQWLPMCLNPTNKSEIKIVEGCRWLLGILVLAEWSNFSTTGFEPNRNKIPGNFEYRSRREFHKLFKEGGSSEFRCQTKRPWRFEVGRILTIWLQIRIDFLNFLLIFKISFFWSWTSLRCFQTYFIMKYADAIPW